MYILCETCCRLVHPVSRKYDIPWNSDRVLQFIAWIVKIGTLNLPERYRNYPGTILWFTSNLLLFVDIERLHICDIDNNSAACTSEWLIFTHRLNRPVTLHQSLMQVFMYLFHIRLYRVKCLLFLYYRPRDVFVWVWFITTLNTAFTVSG